MDSAFIQAVGIVLYGPNFRSAMARELGVTDRTVRRWLAGEFEMSNDHASVLLTLLESRSNLIKVLQSRLRGELGVRYRNHVRQFRQSLR